MSDKPLDEDATNEQKMSRRNFIKLLGAAGAAITLPSLIPLGRSLGASTAGNSSNATRRQIIQVLSLRQILIRYMHLIWMERLPRCPTQTGVGPQQTQITSLYFLGWECFSSALKKVGFENPIGIQMLLNSVTV